MKDFVSEKISKSRRVFALSLLFSVLMAGSIFVFLDMFYERAAREIVESWYRNETFNLQQGNVLSAVSKLQRGIEQGQLIRGALVADNRGQILLKIGERIDLVARQHVFDQISQDISEEKVGLFTSDFDIRLQKLNIHIRTGAPTLLYVFFIVFGFFALILISFGLAFKKILVEQQKLKVKIEMNEMQSQLAVSAALNKMARQVAHDMRSPLMALNVVYSQSGELSNPQKELIKNTVDRINEMAEELLENSRTAISQVRPDEFKSKIEQLIREKEFEYQTHHQRQVKISFRLNQDFSLEGVSPTDVNLNEMIRMISNLINNSVEGGAKEVRIEIRQGINGRPALVILDDGQGIEENLLKKVLQPGFTTKVKGNGLGLSSVKEWIENQGGSFSLDSKVNIGTQITLNL